MDYIRREAAFNSILNLVPKVDDDGYCWIIRGDAATAIDSIPAADVRPVVKGTWKQIGPKEAACTACNAVTLTNGIDNTGKAHIHKALYRYCPNCGADMREETE